MQNFTFYEVPRKSLKIKVWKEKSPSSGATTRGQQKIIFLHAQKGNKTKQR